MRLLLLCSLIIPFIVCGGEKKTSIEQKAFDYFLHTIYYQGNLSEQYIVFNGYSQAQPAPTERILDCFSSLCPSYSTFPACLDNIKRIAKQENTQVEKITYKKLARIKPRWKTQKRPTTVHHLFLYNALTIDKKYYVLLHITVQAKDELSGFYIGIEFNPDQTVNNWCSYSLSTE